MLVLKGSELSKLSTNEFIRRISLDIKASLSQFKSWEETFSIFHLLTNSNNNLNETTFVFEYHLPYTNKNRPDILMFAKNSIYLIEFKNKSNYTVKDLEQIEFYKNEIENYHSESLHWKVRPILLLNSDTIIDQKMDGISICSKIVFINKWKLVSDVYLNTEVNPESFLNGRYNPSLPILEYAKRVFNNTQIPGISRPILLQTENLYSEIENIIENSKQEKRHSIVVITGEPGSGKSALALKIVHEKNGIYINKNNFFIKMLKNELGHHVNLFNSNSILSNSSNIDINQNVVVIDEAQRAWDKTKINSFYGVYDFEQNVLLSHILKKAWSCTVVFIGHDQQIGNSETSKYELWFDALEYYSEKSQSMIYSSPLLNNNRKNRKIVFSELFHLSNSVRSNFNSIYSNSINLIIDNPLEASLFNKIRNLKKHTYTLKITRDIHKAIDFVNKSNFKSNFKTCFIGTPKSDESVLGKKNSKVLIDYKKANEVNPSVYNEIHEYSLENMKPNALSHYQALGLEFELPIVIWNEDYLFYDNKWNFELEKRIQGFGFYYIRNAYRVLLTRGKNGIILFFPEEWYFNKTYDYFKTVGFEEL